MKRIIAAVLMCGVLLTGCGGDGTEPVLEPTDESISSDSSQTVDPSKENSPEKEYEANLSKMAWEISTGTVSGNQQYIHFKVQNGTDKYVNGIMYINIRANGDDQWYDTPMILDNVSPGGVATASARVPIDFIDKMSEPTVEVYRLEFGDKPITTPELTYDDLYKYFAASYTIDDVVGDKQRIIAYIYNTTTKYFTGEISIVVSNPSTNEVLGYETEKFVNMNPGSEEVMFLYPKISDAYRRTIAIGEDFQLTDKPIS